MQTLMKTRFEIKYEYQHSQLKPFESAQRLILNKIFKANETNDKKMNKKGNEKKNSKV